MHLLLLIAAAIALLLTLAIVLVLRTFITTRVVPAIDAPAVSWADYPLRRLLDPADVAYLRERGISATQIRKLRTERRQIYRLCLRSLAGDFHAVQRALKHVVVASHVDRPDLVRLMAAT